MKTNKQTLYWSLVLAGVFIFCSAATHAQMLFKVLVVKGKTEVQRTEKGVWDKISAGISLSNADKIRIAKDGYISTVCHFRTVSHRIYIFKPTWGYYWNWGWVFSNLSSSIIKWLASHNYLANNCSVLWFFLHGWYGFWLLSSTESLTHDTDRSIEV